MRYDLRGLLFDVIIEGVAERARGFRRVQGQPFANGFGADGAYEFRFVVKKWRALSHKRP
ncbi:MAG TPA: hypothetical protein DEH78_23190 [Solibacterales bacterium]|nr:hypothetical protein [Bryobacterales bacterium]